MSKKTLLAFFFITLLFLLVAIQFSELIDYKNSDFFQFWLGSRFLLEGKDPTNSLLWEAAHADFGTERIAAPVFLYPLPLAILLAPLSILPLKTAFIIWNFLSATLLLLSIVALLKSGNYAKTKHLLLPILLANILYRPTTTTFLGGQLSTLFLFFATLAAFLWHREQWFWGGAVLALLALKPSLGFPILTLSILWLIARKYFSALAGIASSGIFLLLISLLIDPNWVSKYLHILTTKLDNEFGTSPTLWGFSSIACGFNHHCIAWLGGISLVLFLALNIWLLHKWQFASPIPALGHLVSISLLITLYLWPYDHILLLISAVYLMVFLLEKGVPYLKVSAFFISISLASILIRVAAVDLIRHEYKETLYGLLPLLIWGLSTRLLLSGKIPAKQ